MPLIDANEPPVMADDTHFVVYFASGEPSWCPDCRVALPGLQSVFGPESAPRAYFVRVGHRPEWRGNQQNKYRHEPYNIRGVPTVVKVVNGQEVERLEDESEDEEQLRIFVSNP